MKEFAVIYRIVNVDANVRHRPAHIEHLKSLLRESKIVDGMKFPDYYDGCVQGVLICKASSKEEVARWFEKDPVIVSGARTFEVREFERMSIRI